MIFVTAIVAAIAAAWRTNYELGMILAIVSVSALAYYVNRFRSGRTNVPTTLRAIPFIAIGFFFSSLIMGLRHPPFMVPEGWQWPPFTNLHERVVHAFALSLWTFLFGLPTMLLLGLLRRLVSLVTRRADTATN